MVRQASVEIGGTPPKGETKVRRASCSPDKLVARPAEGINTMADVLQYSLKKFPNEPLMGYRDLIKTHVEEKEVTKTVEGKEVKETKKWELAEMSDYKYLTYTQFDSLVVDASSGLRNLGLSKETRFNIYASTSINWQVMAHSCFAQSIPFCTAYDSLGAEGLQHSLNEPEVVGVFTNGEFLGTLAEALPNTPTVKYVIYDGEPKPEHIEQVKKALSEREGSRYLHIEDLKKDGAANKAEKNPPKPEDVACIMYTSGSTGAPKGVILTHANLVASVGAVVMLLGPHLNPTDSFLAYLPLAHILEFIVECSLTFIGVTMGYGKVKTLTERGVKNCQGDIAAFKPSIMVGVPAVWELIRKGIMGKVNAGGTIKKSVFNGAYTIKKNKIPGLSSVVDAVVFKAVKAATGGRMRLALSGGAPLSRETQEFLDIALVTMLQGYGMTESCGMCAILTPEFMQYASVGVPVPAIEVKLVDVPDAGYFATNNPPQGEVFIRGPAVTKGYFKRDDITKETINADGWLMTGDVGQWNKDGTISIIDRKKNLVKLSGGEYIAIERLESTYKSSELVSNICVHANSDAKQPMGVIFPREENLRPLLKQNGIKAEGELEELCERDEIRKLVMKEVNQVGKKSGFKTLEILETVVLVPEELPMTAAQKIERKKVVEKYAQQIKKYYM